MENRDKEKIKCNFVKCAAGMGDYRYFLAPTGIIKVEELPRKWGLLEVSPEGRVKMVHRPERQEADKRKEILLLISTLRRLKIYDGDHVSIKKFSYETKNRASITINSEQEEI